MTLLLDTYISTDIIDFIGIIYQNTTMDTNEKIKAFESEEQDKRVRERLNRDKIKLWEPPYTNSEGVKGDTPNVCNFIDQERKLYISKSSALIICPETVVVPSTDYISTLFFTI